MALSKMGLVLLVAIIIGIYYKLFIFGLIPFPGDLLVASYSPWFDYFKIPVQNPLISDVFSQFFLWKYLSIEIFKNGQWPLWNPYSFSGTPLLATYHSATLYPLNILLFLPKYFGWGLFIFSQTFIASINMYLLLSLWVNSKLARITGSIIFSLGGLMTTWVELGTASHALIWLPLSFFAIEKYWKNLKLRYLLILTFSQSFLILAGNAQIAIYSFIILGVYLLIRKKGIQKSYRFGLPILFLLTALLLTSIQLLPSFDLLQKSIRLNESYINQENFGLLSLGDAIKFFIADFFGNPVTRNYWGFLNYSETSGFIGTLTVSLILFSYLYLKRDRNINFFLLLLTFSIVFAFDSPASKLIYKLKLPLLTSSYASRMLFITLFTVAILSAFSISQILIRSDFQKKLIKTTVWLLSAILGAILGIFLMILYIKLTIFASPSTTLAVHFNHALGEFTVALRNSVIPLFLTTLFLVILFVTQKIKILNRTKIPLIGITLLSLITLDLCRYFLKFNPFVSSNLIFPETKELKILKNEPGIFRIGREHAEILPPNTWTAYGLQSLEGYDPLYLSNYAKYINFLNTGYLEGTTLSRYAELSSKYNSPFLDILNVKYFVAILRDENGDIPGDQLDHRFQNTDYQTFYKGGSFAILKNPHALERTFFAKSVIYLPVHKIENLFKDHSFNPREKIIISEDLPLSKVSGNGLSQIIKYSPNLIKIKTQTDNDEILVLADQYDDGWKAEIDGVSANIAPANLILRAVKIPKGTHEIIFYYWPDSFDLGAKISIITGGLILAFATFTIKKRLF